MNYRRASVGDIISWRTPRSRRLHTGEVEAVRLGVNSRTVYTVAEDSRRVQVDPAAIVYNYGRSSTTAPREVTRLTPEPVGRKPAGSLFPLSESYR